MKKPEGDLTIQTLAMPADTNASGDIFGGFIVSQMDLAAGIFAKKYSKSRVVTVAINSMSFLKPVHVGDIITCYAKLLKTGRTSMTISVQTWSENIENSEFYCVTEGVFVFVAIDEKGRPLALETIDE